MTKHYWAYARNAKNRCVLVRCETRADAQEEAGRLKMSDARTVGVVLVKHTESALRKYADSCGWKVTTVRGPGTFMIS